MSKLGVRFLALFLVLPLSVFALAPDSTKSVAVTPADSVQVTVTARSMLLAVLAWPFERILQPTFNAVLYPLRPPLEFVFDHDVIDRGMRLVSFGDSNQIMTYPTFNLRPGASSSLGASYYHNGLIGDTRKDFLGLQFNNYVNGDWDFKSSYSRKKLLETELAYSIRFTTRQNRDAGFAWDALSQNGFQYTDSSWELGGSISNPLAEHWSWDLSTGVEHKLYSQPIDAVPIIPTDAVTMAKFNQYDRGIYQHFWQYPIGLGINYDTKDSKYSPTQGQALRVSWMAVPVSIYDDPQLMTNWQSSRLDHSYHVFSLSYQYFLMIGQKQYELSRAESRANQTYLQNMSVQKTMELLSPEQWRETFLERKVIAVQFRMRQMGEFDPGGAPITAFQEMNGSMPLRGIARSYWDKNVYGLSCEYRWPLLRLVDGVVFNEYGLYGDSWMSPNFGNLKNSWGFGVRVRKPDLFLTRFQVGFHALHGVTLILTISPEFL